jgi:hypothetical protein
MKLVGHVASTKERRGLYSVLVGKPEEKRPLGRPTFRWEDNIKMDVLPCFHFHETYRCSLALCSDLLHQITHKSDNQWQQCGYKLNYSRVYGVVFI